MANQSRKRVRELLFSEHQGSSKATTAESQVRLQLTVVTADGERWCGLLGLEVGSVDFECYSVESLLDEMARLSPDMKFWPNVRCFLVDGSGHKFPLFRNHLLLDCMMFLRQMMGNDQGDIHIHIYQDYERYMLAGSGAPDPGPSSRAMANMGPGSSRAMASTEPGPSSSTTNMAAIYAALVGGLAKSSAGSTLANMADMSSDDDDY